MSSRDSFTAMVKIHARSLPADRPPKWVQAFRKTRWKRSAERSGSPVRRRR